MYGVFHAISRVMAVVGGTVLLAIVVMTCLSILGREANALMHADWVRAAVPGLADWMIHDFGVGEIKGSYEITESGMALVIFAFLPLAQMTGSHAVVDILTNSLPRRTERVLRTLADVIFALALILIAAQLFGGMMTKLRTGQTTLHLEYPLWWGYAAALAGALAAAAVAVYVAASRVVELATGTVILPAEQGAEH